MIKQPRNEGMDYLHAKSAIPSPPGYGLSSTLLVRFIWKTLKGLILQSIEYAGGGF
jgi:hypothetical protein